MSESAAPLEKSYVGGTGEPLIQVEDLKKYFPITGGVFQRRVGDVKAVDGVSFTINKGESFGLVGESGCGKSTIGRTLLRLNDKTDGKVYFEGKDMHKMSKSDLRKIRTKMQIVFQDPFSSLNPRIKVGEAIGEALLDHGLVSRKDVKERVIETMKICGLADYHYDRFPHEFSGGQRQRIGIARALIMNPEFIVADEPVSALDVSIQAQIINLLSDLQSEKQLTYLFISHDLSVVEHLCNRVGVMYLGTMMEMAPTDELFSNPLHPYTKALMSAIPVPDPTLKRERIVLQGDIPSPANPPSGCKFHTRCPMASDICKEQVPEYRNVGNEHFVACHFA
ncbi:ABC transporter ATP-binding protein [Saccharibacillus endophyticus]|uniref:ABC transporter ATP-binding protein n=1 Tax=Saccharibacillus endophyticus TaxID=2060666 RepID=A0ABQ2A4Y3_9BACL|nr:dipeptide ABC transporter ATP-binding protein [Saccharibacillus endophyticus]GGH85461.1 ABC transporter ATP-binding protein [Saccharibacillus endophyticus]